MSDIICGYWWPGFVIAAQAVWYLVRNWSDLVDFGY